MARKSFDSINSHESLVITTSINALGRGERNKKKKKKYAAWILEHFVSQSFIFFFLFSRSDPPETKGGRV